MDRLSEIRARYEAFEDSNDSYKGVRPQYILPVLADDGYSRNWAEIAAHSHEDIPYLLGLLEEAEAENRWIPVGERLPNKFGRYLTTHISTTHKGNKPQKKVSELDWAGDECGWLINGLHQVTHWRPLPEPPKGE